MVGQLVISKPNNDGMQILDVNALSNGVYLIELQSEDFIETKKFIKK